MPSDSSEEMKTRMILEINEMRNKFELLKDEITSSPLNLIFASFRNVDRHYHINFFKHPRTPLKNLDYNSFKNSFDSKFIAVIYSLFNLVYVQKVAIQKLSSYILPSVDGYTARNNNFEGLLVFLNQPSMNIETYFDMVEKDLNELFGAYVTQRDVNFFVFQIVFLLLSDNYYQVNYMVFTHITIYYINYYLSMI